MKPGFDVVIIGGAAMGSASAFFLASNPDFDGTIMVVERDWSYQHSSTSLSLSSIRHQFSNPLNISISQFGTRFIRQIQDSSLIEKGGLDIGFHENGYLFLIDAKSLERFEQFHGTQLKMGADISLLDRNQLGSKFPHLNTDDLVAGSYGNSGEGWFDSHSYTQALRARSRALGVIYREDEVIDLEVGNNVNSVGLASGERIACGAVVNAAGPAASIVAGLIGTEIPVEPRKRSVFVFDCKSPPPGPLPLMVDTTGVFVRPEGNYFLTGCSPLSDPAVDLDDFECRHQEFDEIIWPSLAHRVEAFEAIKVVNFWAGQYAFNTLDHNAIIGLHPEVQNFIFVNGFSGHGLQQSPAMGRAVSELLTYGEYRSLDLTPLGFERVLEGTPFLEQAVI